MLELLTARQSCSERVVIIRIVRVDSPAGPLWRGVMVCDVMSCLHGYSLDSMHSDMSRDMTLPSDGLPHPGVPNGSQRIPKDHTPHTHESERKAFLFHSILMP